MIALACRLRADSRVPIADSKFASVLGYLLLAIGDCTAGAALGYWLLAIGYRAVAGRRGA